MDSVVHIHRKVDLVGGVGSIMTGIMCAFIGWSDYDEGHAWHIWVLMTAILILNGFAMLRHAAKLRREHALDSSEVGPVAKLRI